ncbi:gliding motility-associated C-terminal domain-containing protein [Capnocytophaga canis]|uniref:T9SS type B sorting domain-containing protein n=1 Tax=Capnocytophaga canis TaxID=1848903 RepID=UPI0037D7B03B
MQKKCLLLVVLLFSFLGIQQVTGQIDIKNPVNEFADGYQIVEKNFEGGKATVEIDFTNAGDASIELTLPPGVTVKNGQITDEGAGSITSVNATTSVVTFQVTGVTANSKVKFSYIRVLSPTSHHNHINGTQMKDVIKVTQGGATAQKDTPTYGYQYPQLSVPTGTDLQPNLNPLTGVNATTFKLRAGGNGIVKDVYFSVEYPVGTSYHKISHNGTQLTPLTASTAQKKLFKITVPAGLSNGQELLINEEYTITERCIIGDKEITYMVNWGTDTAQFQPNGTGNTSKRTIQKTTGTANINFVNDNNLTYFTRDKGYCAAVGEKIGTIRAAYRNDGVGSGADADKIVIRLAKLGRNSQNSQKATFKPANVRIINPATQVATPLPASALIPTTHTSPALTGADRVFDVNLSALNSDPDGPGGLEDLNSDGKYDDLGAGQTLHIEFDLMKNAEFPKTDCAGEDFFTANFHLEYNSFVYYTERCGVRYDQTTPNTIQTVKNSRRFHILYKRSYLTDTAYFPPVLYLGDDYSDAQISFGEYVSFIQTHKAGTPTYGVRYKIEAIIPDGIELGDVKFYNAQAYPAGAAIAPQELTISPDRKKITAIHHTLGHLRLKVKAKCPATSSQQITYRFSVIDDYNTPQQCELKLHCFTKTVQIVCDDDCSNNGPVLREVTARRTENSLGWTDETMTTRLTYANPLTEAQEQSSRRALYLDEIELRAKGEQKRGQANNLYYKLKLTQGVFVAPVSLQFTFTSGVRSGTSVTIPISDVQTSTTLNGTETSDNPAKREILWNFTNALNLNTQPLNQGDKFEVYAIFKVDKNLVKLPSPHTLEFAKDLRMTEQTYFFMYEGAEEKYCGTTRSPEMFVANTYGWDQTNPYNVNSCSSTNIGSNMMFLSRRFNSSGKYYIGEHRPGRLIKEFTFTLPKTYKVTAVDYRRSVVNSVGTVEEKTITIPIADVQTSVEGDNIQYRYENPIEGGKYKLLPGMISVHNGYGDYIRVWVQATCGSGIVAEQANIKGQFYDYYYHYGLASNGGSPGGAPLVPMNNKDNEPDPEGHTYPIVFNNRPAITLTPLTNVSVKMTDQVRTLGLTLKSTGGSAAPYTWISIPDVSGVEVVGLLDGTTTLTHIATISGQKMYHLEAAGLAVGASKTYNLKVRLINCANATMTVYAGWNCAEFSQGYEHTGTCSGLPNTFVTYSLENENSLVQLKRKATPNSTETGEQAVGKLRMCGDNWYEYEINSGGLGAVVSPRLAINTQDGIDIAEVQYFYPYDSTITNTVVGTNEVVDGENARVYNLTPYLYGTETHPGENDRQIRVRINVRPNCDFNVGSSFWVHVLGQNPCGGALQGNRDNAITASIDGVAAMTYRMDNTLIYKNGNANNCVTGASAIYEGRHQAVTQSGLGSIGTGGYVVLRIPSGYEIVPGSYNQVEANPSTLSTSLAATSTPTASGATEYRIAIPNMAHGNWFKYQVGVRQKAGTPATDCGIERQIEYYTVDQATNIACPADGTTCPVLTTLTSATKQVKVESQRASLQIENVSVTAAVQGGKERVTFKFDVKNTSGISYTGDLVVSFYEDTVFDSMVGTGDNKVGTITFTGTTINAGASVNLTGSLDIPQQNVCRLRAIIEGSSNSCLCDMSDIQLAVPNPITGLVTDLTVCETGSAVFAYNAAAPIYTSYKWTSSTAGNMNYLSNADIQAPTFKYTGTPLTAVTTFTYSLTVTRSNGCTASQEVVVTVNPAPAPTSISGAFCGSPTVLNLKNSVNPTNPSVVRVYLASSPLADTDNLINGNTYEVSVIQGTCESRRASVSVVISAIPTPMVTVVNATCLVAGSATIANYEATYTYTFSDAAVTHTGATITGFALGTTYTMTVSNGTCSATTTFVVNNTCTIDAVDDPVTATSTITPVVAGNVLGNDTMTSGTVSTSNVDIFIVTPATGAVVPSVQTGTGDIIVPPSTPAGTYTIVYKICSKVVADTCDTATVTVVVPPFIDANDDVYTVTSTMGGLVSNVLSNDTANGSPATVGTVSITSVTPSPLPNAPILDVATGNVTVSSTTPSGTYTITYEICPLGVASADASCDTATVTVVVPPFIDANDDVYTVTSTTGGLVSNVLSNDTANGSLATVGTVSITSVTPSPLPNAPILDAATGNVTVSSTTPSGTYTITYEICPLGVASADASCDTATVTVVVPPFIDANDDVYIVTSTTGGLVSNVLSNDTANGSPATVGTVSITSVTPSPLPNAPILDAATGNVTVSSTTPSGTYTITYEICPLGVASADVSCDTATVTVVVPPFIEANDDVYTVTSTMGGLVSNVLSNDTANGSPATVGTVSITSVTPSPLPNAPILDVATGNVTVSSTTPSGTYTITYEICPLGVASADASCDTATVTIVVTAVTTPTVITATDDVVTVTTTESGTVVNVLDNDKIGTNTPTTSDVTITVTSTPTGTIVPNLDPVTGNVTVPSGTPTGTYVIGYEICTKSGTITCDTATVTIVVTAVTTLTVITATDDPVTVTTTQSGTVVNVLDNDKIGTNTPTTSDVTITVTKTPTGAIVPILDPSTGDVTVPSGTPSGTYVIGYEICTKSGTITCDTATVTIVVTAVTTPTVITATDDPVTVTTTQSGTVVNVLDNDKIGTNTPTTSDVTITVTKTPTGAIVPNLDPVTGNVMVPSGTPTGTYTIGYSICTKSGTITCDTATVTVIVTAVTTPTVITATDDPVTVTTTESGTVVNVLDNDRLGTKTPTTSDVTITVTSTPTGTIVPNLDPVTGNVTVPSGTPTGTYVIGYEICTKSGTITCDTATVTIVVTAVTTPTVITATDDPVTVTTTQSGTVVNVLDNDKIGTNTPTTSDVTITVTKTPTGAIVPILDPSTGDVTVPSGTPSGTYEIGYKICTKVGTVTCSTATVTITVTEVVTPTVLIATDDPVTVTTTQSGTVVNVLDNDKIGTNTPTTSDVTITVTKTPTGAIVPNLDPVTGNVTVPSGTPTGTYTIGYSICTKSGTITCATATVVITVTEVVTPTNTTVAKDDINNTYVNTQVSGSVGTNDLDPEGDTQVWTIQTNTVGGHSFVLNADGTYTFTPSTGFVGTVSYTYEVCDNGTPQACATATIYISVRQVVTPTATSDTFTATTSTNTQTVGNVLNNDRIGTNTPTTSDVTITVTSTPTGAVVPNLDPSTGNVTVPSGTPTGTYVIGYEICTKSVTITCDTATVTIVVTEVTTPTTPVVAKDDVEQTVVDTPVTVKVVSNDEHVPTQGTLTIVTQPKNGTVVINDNGTTNDPSDDEVVYTPNRGYAGVDSFEYELCDTMGNCSIAKVTITVLNDVIPHNGISVNGDGLNDYFHIQGIERYPNNTVRIYSRWGVKVFETKGYDNVNRVFRAISNGRVTIEAPEKLPQGTYYYIIEYTDNNKKKHTKGSWLYIKK